MELTFNAMVMIHTANMEFNAKIFLIKENKAV